MSRSVLTLALAWAVALVAHVAAAADQPRPDQLKVVGPDQVKPDQVKVVKPDQVKPDQVKVVKPDQVKPDQVKIVKPDQVKPDQVKPDQVKGSKHRRAIYVKHRFRLHHFVLLRHTRVGIKA